jgi:hypothetical protein
VLIFGREEMSKVIPTADVGAGDGAGGGSPILKGDDVEGKSGVGEQKGRSVSVPISMVGSKVLEGHERMKIFEYCEWG